MDPNTTLSFMADCLRLPGDNGKALDDAAQALWDWLRCGGFAPNWDAHPTAASYYRCRAVYHDRGQFVEDGF